MYSPTVPSSEAELVLVLVKIALIQAYSDLAAAGARTAIVEDEIRAIETAALAHIKMVETDPAAFPDVNVRKAVLAAVNYLEDVFAEAQRQRVG